jgi:hypothetical protein
VKKMQELDASDSERAQWEDIRNRFRVMHGAYLRIQRERQDAAKLRKAGKIEEYDEAQERLSRYAVSKLYEVGGQ